MPLKTINAGERPLKSPRLHTTNRVKVLLCYLLCFALPLLWLWAGLTLIYPYYLAGTASAIAQNLLSVFSNERLAVLAASTALPESAAPEVWSAVLQARDQQWKLFLCVLLGISWVLTLVCQLGWRGAYGRAVQSARSTAKAIAHYRLALLVIFLINAAAAAVLWFAGVQFIQGRTLWDYLVYFLPYGLNVLAAFFCFRLAAPPVLSGKHGFFKRL